MYKTVIHTSTLTSGSSTFSYAGLDQKKQYIHIHTGYMRSNRIYTSNISSWLRNSHNCLIATFVTNTLDPHSELHMLQEQLHMVQHQLYTVQQPQQKVTDEQKVKGQKVVHTFVPMNKKLCTRLLDQMHAWWSARHGGLSWQHKLRTLQHPQWLHEE